MKKTVGMRVSALGICAIALGSLLPAQAGHTIRIRVLDGKTGLPAEVSNYLLRVDGRDTVHNDWVHRGDDGTVTATLPANVKEISIQTTDSLSIDTYINCDVAKENNKDRAVWYPVAEILQSGIVAPNECGKTHYTAKPGEFLFFVRKRSFREREF